MDKYTLEMTKGTTGIVSASCECFARIKMGQFGEITWHCLDFALPSEEYCERRDEAKQLLLKAREHLYPELHGEGHSYGIGKFKNADLAFGVHQVLRHAMGDGRTPFSYYPLPTAERGDTYVLRMNEEYSKVVSQACEFYSRMRMGQFKEISLLCLDSQEGDIVERSTEAVKLLLQARDIIYPDLREQAGVGGCVGISYGVGKFDGADLAFDVHQVIRRAFGDPREPFSHYELPKFRKED